MEIVEGSYYDHSKHGRVRVVTVSDGIVSMECMEKMKFIAGQEMPAGVKESDSVFEKCSQPADMTIDAEAAEFDLTGNNA